MPVFEMTHPDGRTFEVEAPDMNAAAAAVGSVANGKPASSATEAFGRGMMQGATFNFYDELTGLAHAGGLDPDDPHVQNSLKALLVGSYRRMQGDDGAKKAYDEQVEATRAKTKQMQSEHPVASVAGEITGALAIPGAAMLRGAKLLTRIGRGAAAGGIFGGLSGVGEGEDTGDRIERGAIGAGVGSVVGGAAPALVEGVIGGARAAASPVVNAVRGAVNPDNEAARRAVTAIDRDIRQDPQAAQRLTPQEFVASRQQSGGGPATVLDLGGETTRALARSAANTSAEGRQALNSVIDDRFEGQAGRVTQWLRDTFHFPNAAAQREALDTTARTVNRPAYVKAYRDGSGGIWSPELERLAGSDAVASAMQTAAKNAKDESIIAGYGAMNPRITFTEDGRIQFNRGAGGVPTYPDLQYWDLVRREISDAALNAGRGTSEARRLNSFATALNAELDRQVPSYQVARQGAAHFFGAENALEAGESFVTSRLGNQEARQALARMSQQERQLFQDGFVSRFIATLGETGDRRNVLNQIAESPAARERLMMVLGPQRSAELEAGLRVEGIMDLARRSVQGNSTTARQLAELGFAGGAGGLGAFGTYNMDPKEMTTAAMMGALLAGRRHIDQRVARRVAEMLASNDPGVLQRGLRVLARNDRLMDSLRTADLRIARAGGQQSGNIPALQAPAIGRADQGEPSVPRPPSQ